MIKAWETDCQAVNRAKIIRINLAIMAKVAKSKVLHAIHRYKMMIWIWEIRKVLVELKIQVILECQNTPFSVL